MTESVGETSLRGRGDIIIPNHEIFEERLSFDCQKVFKWVWNLIDSNSKEQTGHERLFPDSGVVYIPGGGEREWIMMVSGRQEVGNSSAEADGDTTALALDTVEVGVMDVHNHVPRTIFMASFMTSLRDRGHFWTSEANTSGICRVIDGETWMEVTDEDHRSYDFHEGVALRGKAESQEYFDKTKAKNEILRARLSEFVEYITT